VLQFSSPSLAAYPRCLKNLPDIIQGRYSERVQYYFKRLPSGRKAYSLR
jgi:hypothetical protein